MITSTQVNHAHRSLGLYRKMNPVPRMSVFLSLGGRYLRFTAIKLPLLEETSKVTGNPGFAGMSPC
jgi:hypothetical protein